LAKCLDRVGGVFHRLRRLHVAERVAEQLAVVRQVLHDVADAELHRRGLVAEQRLGDGVERMGQVRCRVMVRPWNTVVVRFAGRVADGYWAGRLAGTASASARSDVSAVFIRPLREKVKER
jgi:hypothetical protein